MITALSKLKNFFAFRKGGNMLLCFNKNLDKEPLMTQDVSSQKSDSPPFQKIEDLATNSWMDVIKTFGLDIKNESNQDELRRLIIQLQDINPKGAIEEMLATQMIGTHKLILQTMRVSNAMSVGMLSPQIMIGYIGSLTKLSRTFMAQTEALNKHRGKGQQKMTVEHVHVNSGGQAIIGQVEVAPKKGKKGGVNFKMSKSKDQPHG